MQLLFVIMVMVVASRAELSQETKEKVMQYVQEYGTGCAESENANGDDIGELMAKKMPSRKEGKCLLACFNQKIGVQDKDGKLSKEGAMKTIEIFKEDQVIYGKLKGLVDKCMGETKDTGDRCETAVKYGACGKKFAEENDLTEEILM